MPTPDPPTPDPPAADFNGFALRRHDWVWLNADPDPVRVCAAAEGGGALTAAWRAAARPFIAARRFPDDPAGFIRLGLATPDKRRIGLTAPASAAARVAPAPLLADAACGFSGFLDVGVSAAFRDGPVREDEARAEEARTAAQAAMWTQALTGLAARAADAGFTARVFGSLAWGFLTGLSYVRPDSDVDLLFAPESWSDVLRLVDLLTAAAAQAPPGAPRLDGEIVLPGGWGASWRELAARPRAVLLKGGCDAVLHPYERLPALFDAAAGPTPGGKTS